jgi:hypothetical protein
MNLRGRNADFGGSDDAVRRESAALMSRSDRVLVFLGWMCVFGLKSRVRLVLKDRQGAAWGLCEGEFWKNFCEKGFSGRIVVTNGGPCAHSNSRRCTIIGTPWTARMITSS